MPPKYRSRTGYKAAGARKSEKRLLDIEIDLSEIRFFVQPITSK